jgi:tetratricopeptide (TPR) repeat protein/CHAT domain-containing protein
MTSTKHPLVRLGLVLCLAVAGTLDTAQITLAQTPSTQQEVGEIGVQTRIDEKTKQLIIQLVASGGAAEKAGLKPGDIILEVDRKTVIGESQNQTISRIRGVIGTPVKLKLQRGNQTVTVEIIRGKIQVSPPSSPEKEQADALLSQGNQAYSTSDFRGAMEKWNQALKIYVSIGDKQGEGNAYGNLGVAYQSLGDYPKAIEFQNKRLQIALQMGDKQGERQVYDNLGLAYYSLGDYQKAIEYQSKSLQIKLRIGDKQGEGQVYSNLGLAYYSLGDYQKAIEFQNKRLQIALQIGDKKGEGAAYGNLGNVYYSLGDYQKAIEFHNKALQIDIQIGDKKGEGQDYGNLGAAYRSLSDYPKAIDFYNKSLQIFQQIGDKKGEGQVYGNLGLAYDSLGDYPKAIEYHNKALQIDIQIGDKKGEGQDYVNLGLAYYSLGNYQKAIVFHNKALLILQQIGDKNGEGSVYGNLGNAYFSLGDYQKAIEYHNKALQIALQVGNKKGEGAVYGNLGNAYQSLGDYPKAIDSYNKSLQIFQQIGDKKGEGQVYGNLGNAYYSLGDYQKAIEFHNKALQIDIQIGDKKGEGQVYGNLGNAYYSLGDYQKAIEFQNKRLQIALQMGDKKGEGQVYGNLGLAYDSLGDYQKAIGFHNKALQIALQMGDKKGEGQVYNNLGIAYNSLGDYPKAIDSYNKSLQIFQQIGDKQGEGNTYSNLGNAYYSLGDYQKVIEFHNKALQIVTQIGDKKGEGVVYGNLGAAYQSLGDYQKAIDFYNKSLQIDKQIGDKQGEGNTYGNLGAAYQSLGDYPKAIGFHNKALQILQQIGNKKGEGQVYGNLGNAYEKLKRYDEALLFQQKAIAIYSAIGTNQDLYYPQWAIARTLFAQEKPDLAILFYKQAVNTVQTTKERIKDLDPTLKKSFGESKSDIYRELADLLLKQGRVLEAQKVLELLKEQEVNELLRSAPGTGGTTSLNEKEEKTWQDYQKTILRKELEIYQQRDLIDAQIKLIPPAERPQSNTYKELSQKRAALEEKVTLAVKGFELFLKQAAASLKTTDSAKSMEDLQTEIARYNKLLTDRKAAVISTLVLPDRLELILLTPDTEPLQRTVKVTKAELDALILKTRLGISKPGGKALPDLQKLYQYVVAPLEPEIQQLLKDKKIDTLVFAPDQNLRLIPLEALHDGKQYLIERLPVGIINSLSTLSADTLKQPQMMAMGLSKAQPNFPGFDALPGVVSEVNSIGKLYNGQVFLNEQFTKIAIQEGLGTKQPLIMHMATHANFGDTKEKIFVLLFGEKLSLEDIKSLDLRRISLLTLSACETATSSNSGVGLASIAGGKGAQSVLGSLWPVSDESTSQLMQRLYANLKAGMSKAEALRQAQLTLLSSGMQSTEIKQRSVEPIGEKPTIPKPRDYKDPFYWAPFILIGDWR